MIDYHRNPGELFPNLPVELEQAREDVHAEYARMAETAAGATFRARTVSASGAQPELTESEQYAIAYVAGLRPKTGLIVQSKLQMVMPECAIHWDDTNGRFIVQEQE